MDQLASSKHVEKHSKFYGYLYTIKDAREMRAVIDIVSCSHKKACHICYGAIVDGEMMFKNDGEVGMPGKQLLSLLEHHQLDNHVLIVARIFGRVKLGPAGVGRAFKEAGKRCLEN
ncbi:MAG: YigZ family protein [Nanoarchaeota archaeon]